MVGARGFEPPTSSSRTMRATKLRHAPTESPVVQGLRMIAQAGGAGHQPHSENRSTGSGVVAGGHETIDFGGSTDASHRPATADPSPWRPRRPRSLSPPVVRAPAEAQARPASSAAASCAQRRSAARAGGAADVGVGNGAVGAFLTGKDGKTLYVFTPDSANKSTCTDQCATNWPPFTVPAGTTPKADSGVTGTLTTFARAGRNATGRDQRPAAVLLRQGHQGRRYERPGRRWQVVRRVADRRDAVTRRFGRRAGRGERIPRRDEGGILDVTQLAGVSHTG